MKMSRTLRSEVFLIVGFNVKNMSLHNVVDMTRICYTYEANQGCSVVSIYFQIIIHRDLNKF